MKRITIKDLARMAGVSIATVSMVLNGKSNISVATREKIKALAKKHNYIPNASARGLVSSKTNSIGILIQDIVEPFNAATLRAISKKVETTDYRLFLYDFQHHSNSSNNHLDRLEIEGRVDGIIYKGVDLSNRDRSLAQTIKVPMVILENELNWVDCVSVDNYEGSYDAAKYLLNQGHKKVGLISCEAAPKILNARTRGVKKALLESGLKLNPKHLYKTSSFTAQEGIIAADYFHQLKNKPTAVFSIAGDYIACGFLSRIKKLGYRVKDDFALVGFDDLEISSFVDPQLTTVKQPLDKMACAAIELLLARLENKTKSFESRKFKTEFVIRESA